MGKAFDAFTENINKATASRGKDGIPCITALAADGSGMIAFYMH